MKLLNKLPKRMRIALGLSVFFISLTSSFHSRAQCQYDVPAYDVRAEKNIVYGIQKDWAGRNDTLRLDLYKPLKDGNTARPLLMLIHGGGFSSGDKSDLEDICSYVASCGVVCASLEYRLGFVRPLQLDYPYTYDQAEILRAIYRSQQDAKGALRFLKGRYQEDSTDQLEFYSGGFSAGGFIALATAYFTDSSMRFPSTRAIANAVNLNGSFSRPDLGSIDGPLHQNGQDASVKGVFNFFGAVHDTAIIQAGSPKIWQYHQTADPVVPCGRNKPYHGIGLLIPDNYPLVSGSCEIQKRLNNLGSSAPVNTHIIHNGSRHDVHDIVSVRQNMMENLNSWICDQLSTSPFVSRYTTKVYPNPSNGSLYFTNHSEFKRIRVFNMFGSLCFSAELRRGENAIHTDLSGGSYVLIAETFSGKIYRQMLLVNGR
jgi:hypothetical protein